MVRKSQVPESTGQSWDEQQALLSDVEVTPYVAEFVWAITTYKAVRDIYLLSNIGVRTSSLDSDGRRIYIIRFNDKKGFSVCGYWSIVRDDRVGVSSARK
jgi:hypothetical protein